MNMVSINFSVRAVLGFPCGSAGKVSACSAGDLGSIPGLGKSPGGGNSPVFFPGESPGQRNLAATVQMVAKSRIRLSD